MRCNLRCLHCGSKAGKKRPLELSVTQCLKTADELWELGCKYVTFIGGEILLYPGWEKIARHLSRLGAQVNIISNGWSLGDKEVEQIKYAKLINVGLSLDGLAGNHDKIRGRQGSYQRVLQAIDRLRAARIDVGIITTLMDFNLPDLNSLHQLLVSKKVTSWQIQIATSMGQMAAHQGALLNSAKMAEITRFFRVKSDCLAPVMVAGDNIGYYDEHESCLRNLPGRWGTWGGCQAGLSVIGIDSAGNVRGCESLYDARFIEGNVLEEPLQTIWFRETGFAYNRQFDVSSLQGKCRECDKAMVCRGGCSGINYFSTGSVHHNVYCAREW